jgi:hypothetical protein
LLLEDLLVEVDQTDAAAVASAYRRHARLVTDWRAVRAENIGFQKGVRGRRQRIVIAVLRRRCLSCLRSPTAHRRKSGCLGAQQARARPARVGHPA